MTVSPYIINRDVVNVPKSWDTTLEHGGQYLGGIYPSARAANSFAASHKFVRFMSEHDGHATSFGIQDRFVGSLDVKRSYGVFQLAKNKCDQAGMSFLYNYTSGQIDRAEERKRNAAMSLILKACNNGGGNLYTYGHGGIFHGQIVGVGADGKPDMSDVYARTQQTWQSPLAGGSSHDQVLMQLTSERPLRVGDIYCAVFINQDPTSNHPEWGDWQRWNNPATAYAEALSVGGSRGINGGSSYLFTNTGHDGEASAKDYGPRTQQGALTVGYSHSDTNTWSFDSRIQPLFQVTYADNTATTIRSQVHESSPYYQDLGGNNAVRQTFTAPFTQEFDRMIVRYTQPSNSVVRANLNVKIHNASGTVLVDQTLPTNPNSNNVASGIRTAGETEASFSPISLSAGQRYTITLTADSSLIRIYDDLPVTPFDNINNFGGDNTTEALYQHINNGVASVSGYSGYTTIPVGLVAVGAPNQLRTRTRYPNMTTGGTQDPVVVDALRREQEEINGEDNNAPVIVDIASLVAIQNVSFVHQIQASDIDGDTLTYSAVLPAGLSIDQNGRISGIPTGSGAFSASVTVSDGELEDTVRFTINIQPNGEGGGGEGEGGGGEGEGGGEGGGGSTSSSDRGNIDGERVVSATTDTITVSWYQCPSEPTRVGWREEGTNNSYTYSSFMTLTTLYSLYAISGLKDGTRYEIVIESQSGAKTTLIGETVMGAIPETSWRSVERDGIRVAFYKNRLQLPDDGQWYQVQRAADYTDLWQGRALGQVVTIQSIYSATLVNVINLTVGKRIDAELLTP